MEAQIAQLAEVLRSQASRGVWGLGALPWGFCWGLLDALASLDFCAREPGGDCKDSEKRLTDLRKSTEAGGFPNACKFGTGCYLLSLQSKRCHQWAAPGAGRRSAGDEASGSGHVHLKHDVCSLVLCAKRLYLKETSAGLGYITTAMATHSTGLQVHRALETEHLQHKALPL